MDHRALFDWLQVAFVDEIFKANSAILNALLTLLNERLFDNGNQRLAVPLLCLVGEGGREGGAAEGGARCCCSQKCSCGCGAWQGGPLQPIQRVAVAQQCSIPMQSHMPVHLYDTARGAAR